MLKRGILDPMEFNINKADGTNLWVTLQSSLFLVGGQTRIQTIIKDITKRKKIELALKASEEKFRHLFEVSPYALLILDLNGKLIDYNSACSNLFFKDIKEEEIKDKTIFEVIQHVLKIPEDLLDVHKNRMQKLFEGQSAPLEIELEKISGEKIWVYVNSTVINIEETRLIQIIIQDITIKKIAEQRLKKSQFKLEKLSVELDKRVKSRTIKLQNSEEKYRSAFNRAQCFKGLFNHDISNIINSIGNSVELCKSLFDKNEKTKEIIEHFDLIQAQISRGK